MRIFKTRFGKPFNGMLASVVMLSMTFGSFAPIAASAATCQKLESGTLIKVKGHTAVYLLAAKKSDAGYPFRKYFPNAEVFYSWFTDFSGVVEVDPSCIDDYQSGGGINFRPGSFLVKTDVSPNVYAVGPNNMKHLIPNEQVASALYGAKWASKVRVLADAFDANLKKGTALVDDTPHNGMIIKMSSGTGLYFVVDGKYQEVDPDSSAALTPWANTVTEAVFNKLQLSGDTADKMSILKDPTQDGGLDLSVLKPVEPVSDALTTPGGKRLTVPWAEGTFSLEIPYANSRTLGYDVKALEADAYTPLGYNAYMQVSAEGTSYENAGIEWFEPFIIQIIPRGWWNANTKPSGDGLYEIISMEDGPGKYVEPWYIYDDFVYIHVRNVQDCPLVESGEESDLCNIFKYENEIKNSFRIGS